MGKQPEQNTRSYRSLVDGLEEMDLLGRHLHRQWGYPTVIEGGSQEVW